MDATEVKLKIGAAAAKLAALPLIGTDVRNVTINEEDGTFIVPVYTVKETVKELFELPMEEKLFMEAAFGSPRNQWCLERLHMKVVICSCIVTHQDEVGVALTHEHLHNCRAAKTNCERHACREILEAGAP